LDKPFSKLLFNFLFGVVHNGIQVINLNLIKPSGDIN